MMMCPSLSLQKFGKTRTHRNRTPHADPQTCIADPMPKRLSIREGDVGRV